MEKNVTQRLIVVGLALLFGVILLRDPRQTLRPGLDIAGGTSLIFEIDTTDADDEFNLAERVKQLLQRRVDPKGIYDLNWRVQGRNRIEVQMPLPPKDAKARREVYRAKLNELFEPQSVAGQPARQHEITRGQIEKAVRLSGEERQQAIRTLAERNAPHASQTLTGDDVTGRRAAIERSVAEREGRLLLAAEQYDALLAARATLTEGPPPPDETDSPTTEPATTQSATAPVEESITQEGLERDYRDAQEEYEDAIYEVLETNLSRRRFQEILELDVDSKVRQSSLRDIEQKHPDLVDEIEAVVQAHTEWRGGRRFLDGPGDLKRLLRGSGKLEFRILAEPSAENITKFDRYRKQLTEEGVKRRAGDAEGWFKVDNPMQFFNLNSQAELEGFKQDYKSYERYVVEMLGEDYHVLGRTSVRPKDGLLQGRQSGQRPWKLTRARADRDQQGRWCVRFRLDVIGGSLFGRLTEQNIGKPLCILVDDVAYSAPTINSKITTEGEITGEFSQEKVTYLVRTMEGGMLPARLKDTPLSERTVGSSLGESNRDNAVRAGLLGALAVIAVMAGYYLWVCGSIANLALAMNVFLILAAMAMLSARITLVGIGGIILSVGMAVDANVLIFERMREERQRGKSLRMIIRDGYDKALSTIFDANITTLLTCIIIYYVGSEEVKGFGLTLGWGIVLNLFTSVFVTRTLFSVLLKYNLIKDIKMLRLIGVPKIDWYSKRKFFIPTSLVIMAIGLGLLYQRGMDNFLDVEFLGGVAAEFETKRGVELDDVQINDRLTEVGVTIVDDAERLAEAAVEPVTGEPGTFAVRVDGVAAQLLAAMLAEPLESANLLERSGVVVDVGADTVKLYAKAEVTQQALTDKIHGLVEGLQRAGQNLTRANVNAVLEVGGVAQEGRVWNLTTTVTNMRLVEHALADALGGDMRVQPSIAYDLRTDGDEPYPITGRLLEAVVPGLPVGISYDLTNYLGGVAFHLAELNPPQSTEALYTRLDNMHFQPDFQDQPKRPFDVIGVEPVEGAVDEDGHQSYRSVVVVAVDPDLRYQEDPDQWYSGFVSPERHLIETALETEQTLRKVMQFKPQIAARSTQQASLALLLSWGMIIGYLWIRFGRPMYGVAGVAALIHDALIALAFVGISGWIGGRNHPIGEFFLISDFKINMTIVAALLTIIGYSINDTIVVFDRIRETRGRLGIVTPEIINASINQTLARTIITSMTTLIVLLVMYTFGGSSIRGFNFCMIIGILTGSYSSIAVAAPLLMAHFFGRAPVRAR